MKKYNLALGAILSTFLTLAILPVRLSEGQGNDVRNLTGSEIVIWTMCLAIWCATSYIQYRLPSSRWQKIMLAFISCAVLSNVFYYTFNSFFEDYPMHPMRDQALGIAVLRLSLRGLLVGMIMVPIAFLLENERKAQQALVEREEQRAREAEEQNRLLEVIVAERTKALGQTLSTLSRSQDELDNQVYLLSRLVASVSHDVSSPLNYAVLIASRINQLIAEDRFEEVNVYAGELARSLTGMSAFMKNLLAFIKTQINREAIRITDVNLASLVKEKCSLFQGIADAQKNVLAVNIDPALHIHTNHSLLSVILHNLFDNAIRYTSQGVIAVSAPMISGKLHLLIENPIAEVPEGLFDHLTPPGSAADLELQRSRPEGHGIGLILVRDIAALLNILFFIEVNDGKVMAHVVFDDSQDFL